MTPPRMRRVWLAAAGSFVRCAIGDVLAAAVCLYCAARATGDVAIVVVPHRAGEASFTSKGGQA